MCVKSLNSRKLYKLAIKNVIEIKKELTNLKSK